MNQPWIYIVLVGLVLIVYAKIVPRSAGNQGSNARGGSMLSEMEETMDLFAAELDEQNKALIQMFVETKKEYELHTTKLVYRIELLEKQGEQLQQEVSRIGFTCDQLQSRQLAEKRVDAAYARTAAGSIEPEQPGGGSLTPASPPEPMLEQVIPVPPDVSFVMNMKERYSELFELYQQGKSTDYIAKKLGKNKGEINLILQLAKQEELSDA
ncbi:hypothetical protein [Paenibacillus sp. PvR098]|uniref:hypothetical protein n=1 Tax=unclassified Paenibacillus TaxID=185978 RepID=UPI001B474018|nr:TolA-binding protein [Paenibacillus sp. PvP091]MBP1168635.1 TolA-binding protein [Paenibacillus sp. PvR098]MBP2439663.1 TolA-binding protein [Paenibacillus sp. PvP052]